MNRSRTLVKIVVATVLALSMLATAAAAAPGGEKGAKDDTTETTAKSTGKPTTSELTLRTMTYNIHYGVGVDGTLDLERIAAVVEAGAADVIGLQEVDRHFGARSDWVDQASWLADRLGMHLAYGPAVDLAPLDEGDPRRQTGNAVLSRFPIVSSSNVALPYTDGGPRAALDVAIDVDGTQVRFISTHLTNLGSTERGPQVDALVDMLGSQPVRTVLVGDLNTHDTSWELAPLHDVMSDAWAQRKGKKASGATHPSWDPIYRIDYVFGSPDLTVASATVIQSLASDHLPVVVDHDIDN